jgi:hypothetical protein
MFADLIDKYLVLNIVCPRGHAGDIAILARSNSDTDGLETVQCPKCFVHFKVKAPDRVIRGPVHSN